MNGTKEGDYMSNRACRLEGELCFNWAETGGGMHLERALKESG